MLLATLRRDSGRSDALARWAASLVSTGGPVLGLSGATKVSVWGEYDEDG